MTQLNQRISPSGPIQSADVPSSFGRVTTTDATPTAVDPAAYDDMANDSTERVEISATAQGTAAAANSIGITRVAVVNRDAAGAYVIAQAAQTLLDPGAVGAVALDLIDQGDGNLAPQVTGVAATNIIWTVFVRRFPSVGNFS